MNKKKNIFTLLGWAFVAFVVAFSLIRKSENTPATTELYTMNTIVDLKVYGNNKKNILQEAIKKIEEINKLVDDFSPNSDVYRINENAGIKSITVNPETIDMIKKAIEIAHITNSAFDPAIKPISQIWGFKDKNYRIPSKEEIENTLKLIDYNDIVIDKNSVFLKKKGEAIDLGGIAKGYTLDCVKEVLSKMHAERALINMGGNILLYGTPPNKQWRIGIKNPRGDGIIGTLDVEGNKFISTSGDYERFFIKNGKRYCHIINPNSGYPADKIISITVISDKGYYGDGLSTAFFVMGKDQALNNAKKFNVNIVGINKDLKVFYTDGLKNSLTFENEKR